MQRTRALKASEFPSFLRDSVWGKAQRAIELDEKMRGSGEARTRAGVRSGGAEFAKMGALNRIETRPWLARLRREALTTQQHTLGHLAAAQPLCAPPHVVVLLLLRPASISRAFVRSRTLRNAGTLNHPATYDQVASNARAINTTTRHRISRGQGHTPPIASLVNEAWDGE